MKKVIQKRIVKVIQPEIVEYYCDKCGKRCGTKDNPKRIYYVVNSNDKHYCRGCDPHINK